MRWFKWGPFEITSGDHDDGGVDVVTFKDAGITTAVVAAIACAIWLFSLTQAPGSFISGLVAATWPMAPMILLFVWLSAILSWLLRGFRNQG